MLYTIFIMKTKLLFSVVLTSICLVLPACRKNTPSAEGTPAQSFSQPPIENNYKPEQASVLEGDWKGTLQIQQAKLRVVLHINKQADGSLSATLDSIDQGAKGIPANAIQFTPPNVTIQWQGIGGIFDGAFENGKLSGTWQQGTVKIPLVFERD
jgi:hypothetical protein